MKPQHPIVRKLLAAAGGGLVITAIGVSAASLSQSRSEALQMSWDGVNYSSSTSESYYDTLLIDWNTGQTTLHQLAANGETTIIERELAQGAEAEITIGYHFPQEATVGNRSGGEPRLAGFDVELELTGIPDR